MAKTGYPLEQTGAEVQAALNKTIALAPATEETTGLMSAADKAKLNGLPSGTSLDTSLSGKVDKVNGKGLSTNDYDDTEKAKVASAITKSVNDLVNYYIKSETYTKAEVQALIAAIRQFTIQVVAELPEASESTMNIIYLVPSADPQTRNAKDEYITIRSGEVGSYTYAWEQIGSTAIDLSGYVTTSDLNTALADYTTTAALTLLLAAKQDTLVSGTNIKTINGQSILGSGNLTVQAGDDAVKYVSQELTSEQKAQARANIGAGTSDFSGNPIVSLSSPTPADGTLIATLANGDTITLDLNHNHPAYPRYTLLADEAAYEAVTTKESDMLYLIPEE